MPGRVGNPLKSIDKGAIFLVNASIGIAQLLTFRNKATCISKLLWICMEHSNFSIFFRGAYLEENSIFKLIILAKHS